MGYISDNVTEIAIQGKWGTGRDIISVLHVQRVENDPVQSARDVLNNWQDHMIAVFVNNYTLQGAAYVDRNVATGATGFIAPDPAKPTVGARAGAALPPSLAVLCKKIIAGQVGRRAGRMYIPPPAEDQVNEDGVINAAEVNFINGKLADFLAGSDESNGLGSPGKGLVVVHKAAFGNSPVSEVTQFIVDPLLSTQRRRIGR